MYWYKYVFLPLSFLALFFPEKLLLSLLFRRSFSSKVVASLTSVSAAQLKNGSRTVFKPVACHKEQKKRWFYVVTLSSRVRSLARSLARRDPCTWRKKRSFCDSASISRAFVFRLFFIRSDNCNSRHRINRRPTLRA